MNVCGPLFHEVDPSFNPHTSKGMREEKSLAYIFLLHHLSSPEWEVVERARGTDSDHTSDMAVSSAGDFILMRGC